MTDENLLISEFKEWTMTNWHPDNNLRKLLKSYLSNFSKSDFKSTKERKNLLIFIINKKLKINKKTYRKFIDTYAKKEVFFNYHKKLEIEETLSRPEINFHQWIKDKFSLSIDFNVNINKKCINLDYFLNKDKKNKDVIESIFSSFIYYSINEKKVHIFNNNNCKEKYHNNYWNHLKSFHSKQINRNNALTIINAKYLTHNTSKYIDKANTLFSIISSTYETLDNHCYMAIIFEDSMKEKWKLISDITLYSEKFNEVENNKIYFRKKEILNNTKSYIDSLDIKKANFHLANEGFTYKDCIVSYNNYKESCILLFEKNIRDETPIPCPKCRSMNIQGNSYPSLGVRSWECKNTFCGDKSKYNRGKRYSLSSIIRQQAILDDNNLISPNDLKNWRRDIFTLDSNTEIYKFIISSYSLYEDNILLYDTYCNNQQILGRNIFYKTFPYPAAQSFYDGFNSLSFFKRFLIKKNRLRIKLNNLSSRDGLYLYNSEAFKTLCSLNSNSIDGAVTSPPYYNARDYSQWKNIYCYLYDMFNINSEVFRCLKNGAPYLFNIFDYFDNEKSVVFSDMGKKRLILSAYISYIFREIGFNHIGNCVWDKGEIQGNRNSNNGNNSPYYQAPLNCWEHIMIFSKGEASFSINALPKIIKEKPVFKIIKGENTYGHSAPFPPAIPSLLFRVLESGSTILDPFSGSMTTGRVAYKDGYNSINIELNKEYCDLSLKMLGSDACLPKQGELFDT